MTDLVVSIDWLAERILDEEGAPAEDPPVRVVDVRDAWEYDGMGHLPTAINVQFDAFRSEDGLDDGDEVGHLPGAEAFADLLGEHGLTREDTIIAYDDTNGVFAARFLVTALVYGFEDVHLLDGDLSAWRQQYPISNEGVDLPTTDVEPVRVEGEDSPLVDADDVRAAIDGGAGPEPDANSVLLDTRDQFEFDEGHIPGAVRFDWQEAVDAETRGVKSRETLEELFAERGVTPDKRVLLYCNTARRLSHTYVVLRWLGFEDVGIYEGSLTEWREIGGELVSSEE
ncbi:Rhodanese-like protein [Salinarchaeum sp. Harcht-Bsk1]|uniref:sulfurtransferase n=1 Tax=Salinarchaeum sp. Harcht-Bsk1 TaxID=1333523 RepID=UPI0003424778|nr:sulfurtransferase [Salinarchaeum sp. Harcht-Bsk1]AGN01929.1 Rhodanese-like protein [Salinarchaeum sp. Harcht-Bsk1]